MSTIGSRLENWIVLVSFTAEAYKLIPKPSWDENRACFFALSEHRDLALVGLQILPAEPAQFGNAKAGIVECFQDQSIPRARFESEHLMNLRFLEYPLGQRVFRFRQMKCGADI